MQPSHQMQKKKKKKATAAGSNHEHVITSLTNSKCFIPGVVCNILNTVLTLINLNKPLPCLCGLQEGVRQSLACSFVGNHEAVQHQ